MDSGESGSDDGETQIPSSLSDIVRLPMLPGLNAFAVGVVCCCLPRITTFLPPELKLDFN